MNDTPLDPRLEELAEAVVFGTPPAGVGAIDDAAVRSLTETANLATAALAATEPPPETLLRRLEADALSFCVRQGSQRLTSLAQRSVVADAPARRRWVASGQAMLLVAAACIALTWWAVRSADQLPSPAVRCELLLASGTVSVQKDWQPGPSTSHGAIAGDIVWSDARQEGYLRFRQLPALDREHQFQLWIVDGDRQGAPVDGGLFDGVSANGDVVVPVNAKLAIGKAKAFVVTVERRGGVVVSAQEDVVATAGL